MLINQHDGDVRRRIRLAALATFLFASVAGPAVAQTADSAYRKFDGVLAFVRQRNAEQYAITSPSGIDEASYVQIGGMDQWVTIRGQDRANPVLLIVHGGPGDPTNPWTFRISLRGRRSSLSFNGTSAARDGLSPRAVPVSHRH